MNRILWSRAGVLLASSIIGLFFTLQGRTETDPKYYAVEVSAQADASSSAITLVWESDPNASGYTISRKSLGASSWGAGTSLSGDATRYVDSSVSIGTAYEYQVSKNTRTGYSGFGYVCAGIDAPLLENRGKVILLVDSLFATDLANELTRLQQDLVGDGWIVIRHDVSRTDSPQNIKSLIKADYAADPTKVRSVFLFGHIPVPYSGNLNPDGHPDHQGAWPTDAYYGDMDGSWTDNSVSNTSAQRQANWNVPGDGKFDQSELPSDVELEVGRVDLANMTCFSNKTPARYEKDLLRQYLNKDHQFRHGLMSVQRRGLICDNFGEKSGEAFAASGWRNFAAFFGAENVSAVKGWNYFSTVGSQSYLWSYGCGGGSYYTCDGIGSSDDFALTDIKSVFTMFLGSYFGDWDNESNFLRAPLGSTSSALAVAWAGRPHWFLHHMGIGETIGYSTRLSQNNRKEGLYSAQNYATHNIHVTLLGDPTLRMHPVIPPSGLSGTATSAGMTLTWTASPDAGLQGYHVYRTSGDGQFTRATGSAPITGTTFTDAGVSANTFTYMVRAIKRERSGSGTYLNPSQGIFFGPDSNTSWGSAGAGSTPVLPTAPSGLKAFAVSASQINLSWTDTALNEAGFKVERKEGTTGSYSVVATLGANASGFMNAGLNPATGYSYRVFAFNNAGSSPRSSEVTATTTSVPSIPASAEFLALDTETRGDWGGMYGADGYDVLGDTASYPAYASAGTVGAGDWTWAWVTDDSRGLQVGDGTGARVAVAWYSNSAFFIDLDLEDGQTHQVALYCADWDTAARRQTIEVLDASTGAVLDSRALSDFHAGAYLVWNLAGHVRLKVTRNGGVNAVASGLFFDPPSSSAVAVASPTISPDGGIFSEPTVVTIQTVTPGAVIHYTLDGAEPTTASPLYEGPITLSTSALVKTRAFKSGMAQSAVASALFRLNAIVTGQAQALFVRKDTTTQGSWKGVYGDEGYDIAGDPSGAARFPGYVAVQVPNTQSYVWNDRTSDTRALEQAGGGARVAGCWYSETGFTLDVDFIDGRTHRLALYCLDWDETGRSQVVDILDAETGALVTSQTVPAFTGGMYLVWDIKGHVLVRFTKLGGNNAVLMGVFFSPASIQLGNADSGTLTMTSGTPASAADLKIRITGQVGERFQIQTSSDLAHWEPLTEITLPSRTFDFTDSRAGGVPKRFYRALPATVNPAQ